MRAGRELRAKCVSGDFKVRRITDGKTGFLAVERLLVRFLTRRNAVTSGRN